MLAQPEPRAAAARRTAAKAIGVRAACARAAGMDQAHFHPDEEGDPLATYRIRNIEELRTLLIR